MSLQKRLERMHLRLGRTEPLVYVGSPQAGFWIMQYTITHEFLAGHIMAGGVMPPPYRYDNELRSSVRENQGLPMAMKPSEDELTRFLEPYAQDGFRLPTTKEWLLAFGNHDSDDEQTRNQGAYDLSPSGVLYVRRDLVELTIVRPDARYIPQSMVFVLPEYRTRYGRGEVLEGAVSRDLLTREEEKATIGARLVLPCYKHIPSHRIPGSSRYFSGNLSSRTSPQPSPQSPSSPQPPYGYQGFHPLSGGSPSGSPGIFGPNKP
ncbi:hypothetical protein HYY69_03655 [Candidatus Woesearchaeota archaeon]|nr:hypothetical protein [Candidatus Woesearchaeota archaeon]